MAQQSRERKLTADRLREIIDYDADSGVFTWRIPRPKIRVGEVAGGIDSYGYWCIRTHGGLYGAHILAWLYMTGDWPSEDIDHRDTDRSNNRWNNLREASRAQNLRNARAHRDGTSGFKGVCWSKQKSKWLAKICVNYKQINLGLFDTPENAHAAYVSASKKFHGEFGRTA